MTWHHVYPQDGSTNGVSVWGTPGPGNYGWPMHSDGNIRVRNM
jgi:hypothetical protein